jgi:hypothetical protein
VRLDSLMGIDVLWKTGRDEVGQTGLHP